MRALRALIFIMILSCIASLQASNVQVFFSPKDGVADHLIEQIDKEERQVVVAVYCLTHRGVSDALIRAKRRGVHVEVIVDPFSLVAKMAIGKLTHAKVDLSVWDDALNVPEKGGRAANSGKRRPLMHNKFCVFGDSIVWTGSFNFTYDANNAHRENVVIIEDKELAEKYLKEFREIKKNGTRSYSEYMRIHPPKQKNVLDAVLRR